MATSNIDQVLDRVEYLVSAPFTDGDRAALTEDLGRSEELRLWRPDGSYTIHLELDEPLSNLVEFLASRVETDGDSIVLPTVESFATPGSLVFLKYGIVPHSWLAYYYLIRLTEERFFTTFVDRSVWERDDVATMETLRHHLVDWRRIDAEFGAANISSESYRAVFDAADLLFHSLDPRFVELRPRFTSRLGTGWYQIARTVVLDNIDLSRAQLTERIIQAVEEAVNRAEEREFGRGSEVQREAADEFELRRGTLSAGCARWTYPELEFWSWYAARNASSSALCDWLSTRSEVELAENTRCQDLERSELLDTVQQLLPLISKSGLCGLLTVAGATPPPLLEWNDIHYHNLKVVSYLTDVDSRAALMQPTDLERGLFLFGAIRGPYWAPPEGRPIREIEETGLHGAVALDIDTQLKGPGEEVRVVTVRTSTLTTETPPWTLSLSEDGRVAVLVLSGAIVISPVAGGDIFTPELVVLREGELLTATGRGEGYRTLVLRAGATTTTVLLHLAR